MPKISRSRKSQDTSVRNRKFAVPQKQVLEQIVVDQDQITTVPANDKPLVSDKKLKQKLRHKAWLEKLDNAYTTRKKQQKRQQRKATNADLQTDMTEFEDILNSIHTKMTEQAKPTPSEPATPTNVKQAAIPSDKIKHKKNRKKAQMQEIVRMQKVMQHSAFQQNPLATIRQHVVNTFGSTA
ncbi:ribosome biogenesis protein SLX9-domain-containing protein [Radiomyces spectabilis]|uniref:ribosome biogenesis protein SLX9-domain-containing protein n=1 Tax=Radiomyces spectabilis TaxID=64574 RepID=UPI00221FD8B0|nr:ribosome biogenesis protein SLX9-domain-containing protein [Radiomyces spectabilis]KAI8394030.1 ribosome biogenesis protein SLX9-domain-containing protein [Radiomyces spectabilis]